MNKELIEEIKNLKDKLTTIELGGNKLKGDCSSMYAMINYNLDKINHKLDYLFAGLEDLYSDLVRKENAEKSKRLKDEIRHKQGELNYLSNSENLYKVREEHYNLFHSKDRYRKD